MKNFRFATKVLMGAVVACALSVSLTSCSDDDDSEDVLPIQNNDNNNNVVVSSNITTNTTWTKDKVYELGARVVVENGATLTIEPGTVIKGQSGTGASARALIIARGAKIMAEGTASEPIIFTSTRDNITSGQISSPNLTAEQNGQWGGLIILGRAPISASANEVQIEGIPTSDPNGLYGGNDPADNSGVLKYVSIRHGGADIGQGNEINGLTLGGVGSGTVIENIEVVGNQDDGVEWFGGTVNVTNVIVWNAGDDAIDTDQAWSGTLDNFVVITPAGHCFELDGPEGSMSGSHTIKNGTVVASRNGRVSEDLINTDANSEVSLENIHITAIASGQTINRTVDNPSVSFTDITLDILSGTNIDDYIADGSAPAGITAGTTGKANISAFSNWSWTAVAGETNGL